MIVLTLDILKEQLKDAYIETRNLQNKLMTAKSEFLDGRVNEDALRYALKKVKPATANLKDILNQVKSEKLRLGVN